MNYLVDTNVLSEAVKKKPDSKVVRWLQQHESQLYVSVISIAEIRRGIELLSDGKKKRSLLIWLESLCDILKGRMLHFNLETAHLWGELKAYWEKQGVAIPSLDAQIAATAKQHCLTLVTRNVKDFERTGLLLLNPFQNL